MNSEVTSFLPSYTNSQTHFLDKSASFQTNSLFIVSLTPLFAHSNAFWHWNLSLMHLTNFSLTPLCLSTFTNPSPLHPLINPNLISPSLLSSRTHCLAHMDSWLYQPQYNSAQCSLRESHRRLFEMRTQPTSTKSPFVFLIWRQVTKKNQGLYCYVTSIREILVPSMAALGRSGETARLWLCVAFLCERG
jgi:hypothetical protein